MPLLEEVFGVSSKPVLSYLSRTAVDDRFLEALKSDKQIVVYGSSKQGKTALVSKYVPYDDNVVVRLTPKTDMVDLYGAILRGFGVRIKKASAEKSEEGSSATLGTKLKALIPVFSSEVSASGSQTEKTSEEESYDELPFNLELAQDVSELIRKSGCSKTIILENFHYLDDQRQRQLSFDLRTFQELGIRFIILGVWREKNRLAQFNGDLVDRITEVPVEPWEIIDFIAVAKIGAQHLNLSFSQQLLQSCCESSFSSIGVFQELLKEVCISANIRETCKILQLLQDLGLLSQAKAKKASDYAARHQRALEAVAAGNVSSSPKQGVLPLFLPYYLVKVILSIGYDGLANGMPRSVVHERIQAIHHRRDDVRASDMSNLLHNLAALQSNKNITPPIIDFDQNSRLLQVVDSTFYFFLRNADLRTISDEIPNPLDALTNSDSSS